MDNLRNIFARNCEIRRIDSATASAFMAGHHRLGDCRCRYRYGLFVRRSTGEHEETLDPGTLVAAATFSNARRWVKEDRTVSSYEWIRYASLEGIRVVGGMGKLLNAFIDDVHPDDVMSYADPSSVDEGAAYEKLGFSYEGVVEKPNFTCGKYRLKLYL